jgi:hypothetical protein
MLGCTLHSHVTGEVAVSYAPLSICFSIAILGLSSCGEPKSSPCARQSPIRKNVVSASSSNGSAAGLLFLKHKLPIRTGEEVKIVWHITGKGPLSLQYFDPRGTERVLTFGPVEHLDSNFDQPGDEWGAGFQFDAPGCWRIHLSRKGTSADAWLAIQ